MKLPRAALLAALAPLAAAGLLLAPDRPAADFPEARAGEAPSLVVLEEDEPQTTYPLLAWTMSEQRLAELLFDRFFHLSVSGAVGSRVFQAPWRAGARDLELTLRPGLKFSNGRPVTFDDVAFTVNEVYRRQDLGHRSADFHAATFGNVQQVTPSDGSVPFQVAMPEVDAERYLLTTALFSREAVAGKAGRPDLEGTRRQPVGTGPFAPPQPIDNFRQVRLDRNPQRPPPATPPDGAAPVRSVTLLYAQDAAFQKELMQGSRADLWVSPPPAVLPELRAQADRFGVRSYDLRQWWYVALDPTQPDLARPEVREALDRVVPRQALLARFGGDSARPISGPFTPGSAWAPEDVVPTPEDPKGAEQRILAAGYRREGGALVGPSGRVSLVLGVEEDIYNDYSDVLFALVDAFTRFGFAVQARPIRPHDWRTVLAEGRAAATYDLVLGRWNVDREVGVLDLFASPGRSRRPLNLFGYSNPEVDRLVRAFHGERRGPERESLMKRLHRLLHQDRPYLFLWTLEVQSVYRRDRLTGFRPSPYYYFTDIDQVAWRPGAGG